MSTDIYCIKPHIDNMILYLYNLPMKKEVAIGASIALVGAAAAIGGTFYAANVYDRESQVVARDVAKVFPGFDQQIYSRNKARIAELRFSDNASNYFNSMKFLMDWDKAEQEYISRNKPNQDKETFENKMFGISGMTVFLGAGVYTVYKATKR